MAGRMKKKNVVAVSGGFDPVHMGHVRLFSEAKKLGDKLVVILNGDSWLIRKKGRLFMKAKERAGIVAALKPVDEVYIYNSLKDDVCGALRKIRPDIFANGGDRKAANIPEYDLCEELGIRMVFNVGGGKTQSSSKLLKDWEKTGQKKAKLNKEINS